MIDGVDVRDWNLDRLRSQMGKIEQDIFLFSRSIADNIAFGVQKATQEEIENAAKEAQAHDFIMSFNDGYESEIGERGVTLSGGQRQRLASGARLLAAAPDPDPGRLDQRDRQRDRRRDSAGDAAGAGGKNDDIDHASALADPLGRPHHRFGKWPSHRQRLARRIAAQLGTLSADLRALWRR